MSKRESPSQSLVASAVLDRICQDWVKTHGSTKGLGCYLLQNYRITDDQRVSLNRASTPKKESVPVLVCPNAPKKKKRFIVHLHSDPLSVQAMTEAPNPTAWQLNCLQAFNAQDGRDSRDTA